MWLLTPDGNYKVELIAGYVTSSTSEIYSFGQTEEEVFALAEQSIEKSTFTSDFQVLQGDRFVNLSTCSYEYDNPYEEIKAYTGPVLLIHGTKDTIVRMDYSKRADECYANAELYFIEGGGHGFNRKCDAAAIDILNKFASQKI